LLSSQSSQSSHSSHSSQSSQRQQSRSQQSRSHSQQPHSQQPHSQQQQQSQQHKSLQQHALPPHSQQPRFAELKSAGVLEAVRRLVLGLDSDALELTSEPLYASPENEHEAHDAEPNPLASQTQLSDEDSMSTSSWHPRKRHRSEHDLLDSSQGSQATVCSTSRSALD
jgi:hypothetical protein